jgi:two-component system sensor histidine kinase UhpB
MTMHEAQRSRLSSWWHGIPIRWQVLTAVLATFVVTGFLAGSVSVLDARRRASIETEFNLALWQQYIGSRFSKLDSERELDGIIAQLRADLSRARHVTATLSFRKTGTTVELANSGNEAGPPVESETAPEWFVRLAQSKSEVRNVDLSVRGVRVANISLTGKPDDEIAEAWVLLRKVALWWIVGLLATMLGLYFILGYILGPLISFASGMRELEDGHYDVRLPEPSVRELAPVATNFNLLAEALEKAKADNSKLYQQLIAVQEDERRQIAADLHDEVGPCLFGIMANTSSIKRLASDMPAAQSAPILDATREINHISDKLRTMNRSLLARLRPVALGRVSFEELLSDLVTGFARTNPDINFERNMHDLPHSFGEAIDLTIYRSIQEGITNALRHGQATIITVNVAAGHGEGTPHAGNILVATSDNGRGFQSGTPFGFGISSMRERVRLLNGTLTIGTQASGGTRLQIEIPLPITNKTAA